jgi:hypothetical protein
MGPTSTKVTKVDTKPTKPQFFVPFVFLVVPFVFVAAASAQGPTVTTASVAVPAEIAAPVAAALAPEVVTVTIGTTKLEFWWVKAVPVNAGAKAPAWSDVADGSLVGALRLTSAWNEIRGFTIRPGVYTLRFALQPQNGDHLGISPNREFLLPAPAADDQSVDPIGYEGAVALARKTSRRAHPAAISIDPPAATAAPLAAASNDLGHQVVVVKVPTTAGVPLTFGVVVHGTIEH